MNPSALPWTSRVLAAAGAVLAAASVALSAYAAHGAAAEAQPQLQLAALFGFGHGLALAALARGPARRLLARASLVLLLVGTLLFSGALVAKYAFAGSSAPAPFGGSLLIVGWLLYAIDALRG
ncbi:MAG: DUF423 domain-containing protein [Proteobacteria bacterium]|nr:DUF423 domain-containing protein [Pseudomonadota bacterium]